MIDALLLMLVAALVMVAAGSAAFFVLELLFRAVDTARYTLLPRLRARWGRHSR
jgi:hypothetical protein